MWLIDEYSTKFSEYNYNKMDLRKCVICQKVDFILWISTYFCAMVKNV